MYYMLVQTRRPCPSPLPGSQAPQRLLRLLQTGIAPSSSCLHYKRRQTEKSHAKPQTRKEQKTNRRTRGDIALATFACDLLVSVIRVTSLTGNIFVICIGDGLTPLPFPPVGPPVTLLLRLGSPKGC